MTVVVGIHSLSYEDLLSSASDFLKKNGFRIMRIGRSPGVKAVSPDIFAVNTSGLTAIVDIASSQWSLSHMQGYKIGSWRFCVCPTGVVLPDNLLQGWGLLWVDNQNNWALKTAQPSLNSLRCHPPFNPDPHIEMAYLSKSAPKEATKRGYVRIPIIGTVS